MEHCHTEALHHVVEVWHPDKPLKVHCALWCFLQSHFEVRTRFERWANWNQVAAWHGIPSCNVAIPFADGPGQQALLTQDNAPGCPGHIYHSGCCSFHCCCWRHQASIASRANQTDAALLFSMGGQVASLQMQGLRLQATDCPSAPLESARTCSTSRLGLRHPRELQSMGLGQKRAREQEREERERERERERDIYIYIEREMCVYIYIYICMLWGQFLAQFWQFNGQFLAQFLLISVLTPKHRG